MPHVFASPMALMPNPPMATDLKSASLLEQLRQQSAAARKTEGEAHRPVEEILREMDRALWNAFRWLEEALRHLEVIRPRVQHTFKLLGVLSITAPRYDKGFISYRRRPVAGMELLDHFELFYRLSIDAPVVMKVQPAMAPAMEDRLRCAALQFRYVVEQDEHRRAKQGSFTVAPEITSCIRFEPDYRAQRVEVTLRNVDRFETVSLDFAGNAVGEPALEDLVHLILGESNRFLRRAPLAGMRSGQRDEAVRGGNAPRTASRSVA
ncbi:MAG: hypothetical protein M3Z31_02430 [Pseudomonadota bacterium]|nr:hypothetical protein [Pseudomonadota bacterium]